jgi:hypothetical protein
MTCSFVYRVLVAVEMIEISKLMNVIHRDPIIVSSAVFIVATVAHNLKMMILPKQPLQGLQKLRPLFPTT